MPFYTPPKNDTDRLNFLRTAAQAAALDYASNLEYIGIDTYRELLDFLPQFDEAFLDVAETFGERDREERERDEALGKLKLYLFDLWEVVRRRVRRQGEPGGVLRFYYLDADGQPPVIYTVEEWLELAADVIQGDADAVEAGYAAAVCPTAVELRAILDAAQKEAADVVPADEAHDRAQAAIDTLRTQVDELIADIVTELQFHLRKEEAGSQRRVMRTYGASFEYYPGESRDMDDVGEG